MNSKSLKHGDLTQQIIGVFYEVYNALGFGFLENVYENALVYKLRQAGFHVVQQAPLSVHFEDIVVGEYFADVVVDDKVILELKAVEQLTDAHCRQLYNYLRATDCEVGLLLNFGPEAEFRRVILENERKPHRKNRKENPSNPFHPFTVGLLKTTQYRTG